MYVSGTAADATCPDASGHRIKISGKHYSERWRYVRTSEQADTVWMEQLEEDVRGHMPYEKMTT